MLVNDRSARYAASNRLLERAEALIPLASQTFSKSKTQFPERMTPLFLTRGEGGRAWDADGHEYVDLISGLGSILLGYRDADVDSAIREQLENGINFSMATELEAVLAERLVEHVPCAEMVRFGKNGSDATLGCVRLARYHTGREGIIACGYHGWHDWYIGTTSRSAGVPHGAWAKTHKAAYNDLQAVEAIFQRNKGDIAAVILEPVSLNGPQPGYLSDLIDMAHRYGALVIFDEVITGFRLAIGGAHEHFGVTPDLVAIGKGMGNGMPISVVAGRRDIMLRMEEIFLSSTFGGETLSLAAAIAVVDKLVREPVIEHLWSTGKALVDGIEAAVSNTGLAAVVSVVGLSPWSTLKYSDHEHADGATIRTYMVRELLARGVLMNLSMMPTYAHTTEDVKRVLNVFCEVLGNLAVELETPGLVDRLECPVIRPVFSVRG